MQDTRNTSERDTPLTAKKPAPRWPWLLLVIALAAGGWWWWNQRASPAPAQQQAGGPPGAPPFLGGPMPAIPVRVSAAQSQDLDVYIKALGTVTAFSTVTVRSRVDGELQKVLFKEGQRVKAGDLLAQIDPRAFQVQLAQAQGTLQQNLAQLDNARKDLARYQALFEQDSIARQQVDTQAALVRQYEGTLKTNQAAVDSAKLQLDYTRVTAPLSGRLGLRQVDQGNLVSSGDANGLVILTQTQPISVVFTVPEAELPEVLKQLRAGNQLPVLAYNRADTEMIGKGVLATVDNQIDVTTGTLKMKARFENQDESLFPNQFVNARLHVRTLKNATVIPTAAVQRGTPGTFVYVIKQDRTATVRVIKLGQPDGERVAVIDGLQPGERVVIEGVDRLREGAKVEVVNSSTEVPGAAGGQLQGSDAGAAPTRRPSTSP